MIVTSPGLTDLTVPVVPLYDTVAMLVSPDVTVTVPWALLTVNVSLFGYAIVPPQLFTTIGLSALFTVHWNEPVKSL